MKFDMLYDGQYLDWSGKGLYRASSGLPDNQLSSKQCEKDIGPLPEGYYKVFIAPQGIAQDNGDGRCALKPAWGIQTIPRGIAAGQCDPYWANWGFNRARLEPANTETKLKCSPVQRGGFYLHDSIKGYSHGCIEVEGSIFPLLRKHYENTKKSTIILKIKYAGESTYGFTDL
ncbi:tlde1 domain-containing protein [Neptunomonas phycophila]|uniref:tlde1 domain-containing protein n=1 Tax=Neptunomonas TaxID=75687 RepID=UPI0009489F1E|nr:tlde1 domain-containing protein [Neptunomonas phycophila]